MNMVVTAAAILVLSCSPAPAMNCGKATAPIEKAICADPALKAQDAALSRLYFATLRKLAGKRHELLIEDQRYWLAQRADTCGELCLQGTNPQETDRYLLTEMNKRIAQISTCYDTPNPAGGDVSCTIEVHGCPWSIVSAAAALRAYPVVLAELTKQAAKGRIFKGAEGRSHKGTECSYGDAESAAGMPDYRSWAVTHESWTVTIEGAGEHWIAIRTEQALVAPGASQSWTSQNVETYGLPTGRVLPISELIPALRTDAKVAKALWTAANRKADGPLEDSIHDTPGRFKDADGHPLPKGWSIGRDGALTLFYSIPLPDYSVISSATVQPAVFAKWVAPNYAAWFAQPR